MRVAVAMLLLAACGGGPSAGPDSGTVVDATPPEPAGTWEDPRPIGPLPALLVGDTSAAASEASSYDCAPAIDESGGEIVYALHLDVATTLRFGVDDRAVDVDLHVLSGVGTGCVARADLAIETEVAAGDWFVAVDTFGGGPGGPFTLSVVRAEPGECLVNPLPGCTDGDAPDINGTVTEPAGLGGCPAGMASIDGNYCIDRWEAAIADHSPFANPGSTPGVAVSAPGIVPQGYINQTQAAAACANAGKRLCTDTEWLRACRGVADHTFPYGDARVDGACNDARDCHPAVQYFESADSSVYSMIDNSCLDQLPDGLASTGAHAACVSDDGLWDLMGNLHEWTADPAGTFRGGFFVDTAANGPGCLYATTAHDVSHWDYSTGFRCCSGR